MSTHELENDQLHADDRGEARYFSGRFPVRLPRYLHRHLAEVARDVG